MPTRRTPGRCGWRKIPGAGNEHHGTRHLPKPQNENGARMAYENLLYEKKDQIGYITFNRPKVLNALNRKTMEELGDLLSVARDDAEVRALVLTGAGEKAFIAGADINELAQRTAIDGKEFSLFGQG